MTSSRISGCRPSARSRRSISEASLPSISPAWMPFWISTIGLRQPLRPAAGERLLLRDHHEGHRPPLARGAVEAQVHLGKVGLQLAQEVERLLVVGGRLEAGGLGAGASGLDLLGNGLLGSRPGGRRREDRGDGQDACVIVHRLVERVDFTRAASSSRHHPDPYICGHARERAPIARLKQSPSLPVADGRTGSRSPGDARPTPE